jgi:hypothetical protein
MLPTIMKIDDVKYKASTSGDAYQSTAMMLPSMRALQDPTTKSGDGTVVDTKGGPVTGADKSHESSFQRKQITLTGITSGGDLGQSIKVYATSNNPKVVRDPKVDYRSGSSVGVLSFQIPDLAQGNARVTVFVVDSGSRSTGPMKFSVSFAVDISSEEEDCIVRWSDWSSCSRSCDGGVRQRYDHIDVYPTKDGKQCPSPPRFEEEACETQRCDDMCQWTWTEWSSCSPKCGVGTRHRQQVIQSPLGVCSFTPEDQREDCLSTDCPKDCKLEFTDWSGCSASCDGGQQTRVQVVKSFGSEGGMMCPDFLQEESRECNMLDCSDLGASCSGHCGGSPPFSNCRCDSGCKLRSDCCKDHQSICMMGTCSGRCGVYQAGQCACDNECAGNGDCCQDYENSCLPARGGGGRGASPSSCAGNCGNKAPSGCFCDPTCSTTGDCCSDYGAVCGGTQQGQGGSCSGRCAGASMNAGFDFSGSLSLNDGQFNGNSNTNTAAGMNAPVTVTANSLGPGFAEGWWTEGGNTAPAGNWNMQFNDMPMPTTTKMAATRPAMSDFAFNTGATVRAFAPMGPYGPVAGFGVSRANIVAPAPLGGFGPGKSNLLYGRRLLAEEEGAENVTVAEEGAEDEEEVVKEGVGVDASLAVSSRAFVSPEELENLQKVQDKQLDWSTVPGQTECQCDASCQTVGDCCWDYAIVCR